MHPAYIYKYPSVVPQSGCQWWWMMCAQTQLIHVKYNNDTYMFGLYNKTIYLMCICGKQAVIVIRYNVHPTHIQWTTFPHHTDTRTNHYAMVRHNASITGYTTNQPVKRMPTYMKGRGRRGDKLQLVDTVCYTIPSPYSSSIPRSSQ
jgi:hypothetical protein